MSYGVFASRWRMKFDEMNPAPPVTSTFFAIGAGTLASRLELAVDRVQRPSLDVPLDATEVLADEREDEALNAEDEQHRDAAEQRPREVRLAHPERDPVCAEAERQERANRAERDADPLNRLRPEAGEHVQREPGEAQRRVARPPAPRRVRDVHFDDARPAREHERLRELLLADRPEHRLDCRAPVRVERASEVGDLDT